MALPLMFPVALLSGLLFPLLGERLHAELGGETRSAGLLTLANTVGAALGSLIAGFILLPRLGMETSLFVLALGYGRAAGAAVLAGIRPRAAPGAWAAGGLLAAFALTAIAFPHGEPGRRFLEEAVRAQAPRARAPTASWSDVS